VIYTSAKLSKWLSYNHRLVSRNIYFDNVCTLYMDPKYPCELNQMVYHNLRHSRKKSQMCMFCHWACNTDRCIQFGLLHLYSRYLCLEKGIWLSLWCLWLALFLYILQCSMHNGASWTWSLLSTHNMADLLLIVLFSSYLVI